MATPEFLRRLSKGDMTAFEELYELYSEKLYFYLLGQLRSAADSQDMLQTIFIKLVKKRKLLPKVKNLDAYMFKVARNQSLTFFSQKLKRNEVQFADENLKLIEQSQQNSSGFVERAEMLEEVNSALLSLPPEQLEIINLKIYQELTFKTISEILSISINTVSSRYRYALEKLRGYMENQDEKSRRKPQEIPTR